MRTIFFTSFTLAVKCKQLEKAYITFLSFHSNVSNVLDIRVLWTILHAILPPSLHPPSALPNVHQLFATRFQMQKLRRRFLLRETHVYIYMDKLLSSVLLRFTSFQQLHSRFKKWWLCVATAEDRYEVFLKTRKEPIMHPFSLSFHFKTPTVATVVSILRSLRDNFLTIKIFSKLLKD